MSKLIEKSTKGKLVLLRGLKRKMKNNYKIYGCSVQEGLPDIKQYYSSALKQFMLTGKYQAMALCPFHNEKNRSFSVNLQGGMFYCHACGECGGSIIKFHMKLHNLCFRDAILDLKRGQK